MSWNGIAIRHLSDGTEYAMTFGGKQRQNLTLGPVLGIEISHLPVQLKNGIDV